MSEITNGEPRTSESIQEIGIPQISINLSPSSVIQQGTDANLTAQGQPADAYAVGQRFEEVESDIGDQGTAIAELASQIGNAVLYTAQDPDSDMQERARTNLGLGAAAMYDVAADFDTTASGTKVLDAAQGAILKDAVDSLQESVSGLGAAAGYAVATDFTTDTVGTKVLDAKLGKDLNDSIAPLVSTNPGQGFGQDAQQNARNNIGAIGASDLSAAIADVVRSSSQPDLQADEAAKRRARVNIGALGIDDAVLLTDQYNVITDNQRQIARRNIGAVAASEVLNNLLTVRRLTSDPIRMTIIVGGTSGLSPVANGTMDVPSVDGYTPVGVVGFNISNGDDGTGESWIIPFTVGYNESDNKIYYKLRNASNIGSSSTVNKEGGSDSQVYLNVWMLYVKSAI